MYCSTETEEELEEVNQQDRKAEHENQTNDTLEETVEKNDNKKTLLCDL
jgi:hypothetical protein